MTSTDISEAVDSTEVEHEHPSDWQYIKIALILAVITALEVAASYISLGDVLVPLLLGMMAVKFWLVITWFMHLRFDGKIFKQLFLGGLVLAVVVYIITLTAFEFWA